MAACNNTIGNMNLDTCQVNLGRPKGVLLSLEQQTFATLATAETESNLDSLFLADAPNKLIYIPAASFDVAVNEPILEELDFETNLIGLKGSADILRFSIPNDWQSWNSILGEGVNFRKTVYVSYVYTNGYVVGEYNSDNIQVQFVKATAMKLIEQPTKEGTKKIVLQITPKNPDI